MERTDNSIKINNISGEDFIKLIHKKERKLYQIAYLYVKNEHDALEIIDETIYKAYLSRKKIKNPEYFNTWLTRILINTSIDYLRKNKKLLPLNEDMYCDSIKTHSTEELFDLYDAIDRLDEKCKTVIILKYFENLSINEMSDVLDWPVSTVKNTLHKSLVNLRINLCEEDS